MTISINTIKILKKTKNLLAFSYGSDSTALFYTLLSYNIDFDLALVNYKIRKQSDLEEKLAIKLAHKYKKQIFTIVAPIFENNFEKKARDFRYDFFTKLCDDFGYENVLLAHHFNDRFEWFLRQLGKGAGLVELLGMEEFEKRNNFTIIRPFINIFKNEIIDFLNKNNYIFFNDESNKDEKYERNYIRSNFATLFLQKFGKGVQRSFEYLKNDENKFIDKTIKEFNNILMCKKQESIIAKAVKRLDIVMSSKQRLECMKGDCIISGKIAIVFIKDKAIIFKYSYLNIPKHIRELYRKSKIPKFLRPFLYKNKINHIEFLEYLYSF